MFVNQSPKQLLRAISSFFSIISNSLNRRSIHNNRLIFLRKCPAASPAILPAVSTGSTFEIVALITKRLPVYRFSLGILWSCWNPVVSGVLPHTAQTPPYRLRILSHSKSFRCPLGCRFSDISRLISWYLFPLFTIPSSPSSPCSSLIRRKGSRYGLPLYASIAFLISFSETRGPGIPCPTGHKVSRIMR